MNNIHLALTIAGSDSSGGAGMQADLKVFEEYGVYGLTALTAIVTMDPDNNWAHSVTPIETSLLKSQLKTILAGPAIAAMKTGMLAGVEVIKLVRDTISEYSLQNVVIDPVMVCKGETQPLNPESADALRDMLIPLARVATPNLFEAGVLSGLGVITDLGGMKEAARIIHGLGASTVTVKGGKVSGRDKAVDVFYDGKEYFILEADKVSHGHNHGAGCTFAAAVTAGLASGLPVKEAVFKAKDFVSAAIRHGFAFNRFIGPVFHGGFRFENQK